MYSARILVFNGMYAGQPGARKDHGMARCSARSSRTNRLSWRAIVANARLEQSQYFIRLSIRPFLAAVLCSAQQLMQDKGEKQ